MSCAQCSLLLLHVLLHTADDVHECGQTAGRGVSHRLSDLEEHKESYTHMHISMAAGGRWYGATSLNETNIQD